MTAEITDSNPEKREVLDDNARKFITEPVSSSFFEDMQPNTFTLIVDWLQADPVSEIKLAYKTFADETTEILLISKITQDDGTRKTVKKPIDADKYRNLLTGSKLRLEKTRRELSYTQAKVTFDVKYDIFADEKLYMLEVDAATNSDRDAFEPENFPFGLREVTGNLNYYGYRVCDKLLTY